MGLHKLHAHHSVDNLEENAEIYSIWDKFGLCIIHSLIKMSEMNDDHLM